MQESHTDPDAVDPTVDAAALLSTPEPIVASDTRELLERIAAADPMAWRSLLDRIESRLRVLLHFRLDDAVGATVDPEDLIQEVFVDALGALDRFEYRGPGSLQRWFCGIMIHRLSAARRRAARLPRPETGWLESASRHDASPARRLLADWITTRSGPSANARRVERIERVRSVLAALPQDERDVVLLQIYEGLNGRETAERLGVDPSTVSLRMKRALAACSVRLKEVSS